MYKVLYRKWRPKTFDDVVGQPQVTKTLKNEISQNKISHAYLFTGSRGTGKTSCAKILSKAVNCLNPQGGNPCGVCQNCVGIENGSILDVTEIDAASNNGVENIRNLIEEAVFTPNTAKFRVYIIDEVHMLSAGAFNALLKTLEEPPEHVVFILATTEIHKIPATILSRCQRFDFKRISSFDIADRLMFIAEHESINLDRSAALLIAKVSDGALRDALSILDKCQAHNKHVTEDIVSSTAGLVGRETLLTLVDCILKNDSAAILYKVGELYNLSKDMTKLCEEIIDYFRNLMIIKISKDAKELIVVSENEYEILSKQAKELSLERIVNILDILQESMKRMQKGLNNRVELELCLIRICDPELDDTKTAILDRISKLENKLNGKIQFCNDDREKEISFNNKDCEPPLENTITNVEAKTFANKTKEGTGLNLDTDINSLRKDAKRMDSWPEILEKLKERSTAIAAAFKDSIAYVSSDFILIDCKNKFGFTLLRESAKRDEVRKAIQEVTGKMYKLGPYKKDTYEKKENSGIDPLDKFADIAKESGVKVIKS